MRKLFLLMIAVMATMAVGVSTASADGWTVYDPISGEPCNALTVNGNNIGGGCLVEDFAGDFRVTVPSPYQNHWFTSTFDMRVDSAGAFYAVDQTTWATYGGTTLTHCRDAVSGAPTPWPGQIDEVGGGEFQADIEMCVAGNDGYGPRTTQVITVDVTESGVDTTSLVQPGANGFIQYAQWDSPNTFQIIED
jgi:hypothetical protein